MHPYPGSYGFGADRKPDGKVQRIGARYGAGEFFEAETNLTTLFGGGGNASYGGDSELNDLWLLDVRNNATK